MKLLTLFFYYLLVTSGLLYSCVQYANDHISKACFSLVAVGILLVLNEVRRNARIVTLQTTQTANFAKVVATLLP